MHAFYSSSSRIRGRGYKQSRGGGSSGGHIQNLQNNHVEENLGRGQGRGDLKGRGELKNKGLIEIETKQ